MDGYRRRRGRLGAQQRPRVPKWLVAELDGDPWSIELARRILEWVGVRAGALAATWPLDTWAEARASTTGEWHRIGDWWIVRKDVERVCATMRRARPAWYRRYVDQPLLVKQGQSLPLIPDAQLVAVADQPDDDRELIEFAGLALDVIARETSAGADPTLAVSTALLRGFPAGTTATT